MRLREIRKCDQGFGKCKAHCVIQKFWFLLFWVLENIVSPDFWGWWFFFCLFICVESFYFVLFGWWCPILLCASPKFPQVCGEEETLSRQSAHPLAGHHEVTELVTGVGFMWLARLCAGAWRTRIHQTLFIYLFIAFLVTCLPPLFRSGKEAISSGKKVGNNCDCVMCLSWKNPFMR